MSDVERAAVLREAAEHLRTCSRGWDGGTFGPRWIQLRRWKDALRLGLRMAATELDDLADGRAERTKP